MGGKKSTEQKMGITVLKKNGEKIDGEQYVMGMAATELSYVKEEEALKAWMIVCRTNFRKTAGSQTEISEDKLDFDYISMEELEEKNGRKTYLQIKNQLTKASNATFGKVILWEDHPIDALYHEISSGKTISSEEAYGNKVPYLMAVDSSQDVEAKEYMDQQIYSFTECAKILEKEGYTESADTLKKELKIQKKTEHDYVKTVGTKKNTWTGEEWKKMFHLPSNIYYIEEYQGKIRMISIGKGHNMGLSLYGANVMAEKKKAEEILQYYYNGVIIKGYQ